MPYYTADIIKMKNIVLIWWGSGTSHLLKTLKEDQTLKLTAIISTSDNGKSTGVLRTAYSIPAIGDIRKNLAALSEIKNDWLEYRFVWDFLDGHPVGNLWLLGLIKKYWFWDGLQKAHQLLGIEKHRVLPATTKNHDMVALIKNDTEIKGEWDIDKITGHIKDLNLRPHVTANQDSLDAIMDADMILVGPWTFHTSIISCFLTGWIYEAFCVSKAKKVYIANLMKWTEQYTSYTLQSYIDEFERIVGKIDFDTILAHNCHGIRDSEKITIDISGSRVVIEDFLAHWESCVHDSEKVLQWINKNI